MKNKIYLYAITLVIAGLLITSAAGMTITQVNTAKENENEAGVLTTTSELF